MSTPTAFDAAVQCHREGRHADAERLYRDVLARDPNAANAAFLLGAIALQSGRVDAAVDLFRQAINVDPNGAVYHANLGECYRRLGRSADAMDAFLRAMALRPDLAEPIFNLGLLLQDHGEIDGAIACFERAAELKPNVPAIDQRLAQARKERSKRRKEDERSGRPRAGGWMSAQILSGIAASLSVQGRHESAIALCRRALEVDPQSAPAHNNLGVELMQRLQLDEALTSFRRALAADAGHVAAHCNLGNAYARSGLLDEAIASYRRSIALKPDAAIHSNILFTLPFHPGYTPKAILDEARAWDRLYGASLADPEPDEWDNDPTPERRLRIGYVSPDFRGHCQALFTVPLFSHHDHEGFEIVCYSNVGSPDDVTDRLRRGADRWRVIVGMSDSEVARLIRDDRIDILVDLTMHMENNRIAIFARKPAPVQVCWLAYPGTTGLTAMDYRLTDPHLDPPDDDMSVYSEQSIWLPETFWCYDPLASDPAVSALPARASGRVTFGCLNNFAKLNEEVLALWARVLGAVDGSRLVALAPEGECRRRTRDTLVSHGVDGSRIEFVGMRPRADYLAAYREIDLCLDTFPSNGHTTSLDALWMGVPVVTLVGKTIVGRAGLCQAKNLGLGELVATTPDDYVRIARSLCSDLDRLAELRAGLRARMEGSALMDGARFARNVEAAYRGIWRRWCEGRR